MKFKVYDLVLMKGHGMRVYMVTSGKSVESIHLGTAHKQINYTIQCVEKNIEWTVNEDSLIYFGRYKPRTEKIDYDRILDEYNQMMRESQDYNDLYLAFGDFAHKKIAQELYNQATEFMNGIKEKYSNVNGDTYEIKNK
jgi:hypothetical protein